MARQILHGAVPLAVLPVGGRLQHARAVRTGTLKLTADILDPDTDDLRHRAAALPAAPGVRTPSRPIDENQVPQTSVIAGALLWPCGQILPEAVKSHVERDTDAPKPGRSNPFARVGWRLRQECRGMRHLG